MVTISSLFKILSCADHVDYAIIVIALSSVVWYIWLYAKSKRQPHPLPPGPWGLPIIGNLPFLKPELHTYFQGLAKEHGPIFKLWLGSKLAIVVSSSEVAREILRTNDVIFANHDVPAVALINTYGGIDIAWSPYGPRWRMLRKLCVNKILSNVRLDSSVGLRRRETRRTVKYLADQARAGSQLNLGEQIFVMILNVVTQMLWGATVEEEEREIVGAEFIELVQEMNDLLMVPNISDFFPALNRFDLQGLAKRMRGLAQRLDRLFDRVINQRLGVDKGSEGKGEDFLEVLLKIKDEEDGQTNLNMNDVKALLMVRKIFSLMECYKLITRRRFIYLFFASNGCQEDLLNLVFLIKYIYIINLYQLDIYIYIYMITGVMILNMSTKNRIIKKLKNINILVLGVRAYYFLGSGI